MAGKTAGIEKEIAETRSRAAISFNNEKEIITGEETLQSEVGLISKATGWSEGGILSMPVIRRKSYVSIIQSEAKKTRN